MSAAHLIFTCEGAPFALPIDQVLEVVQMVALAARLPRAPRYCLGAIDYHGRLVPLIELGARLGLCAPHRVEDLVESRVILVEDRPREINLDGDITVPQGIIGFVVEDVSELTDKPLQPLSADSHRFGGLITGSVRWQEQRNALVLDLRAGVLVPRVSGELLRRALVEITQELQAHRDRPEDAGRP